MPKPRETKGREGKGREKSGKVRVLFELSAHKMAIWYKIFSASSTWLLDKEAAKHERTNERKNDHAKSHWDGVAIDIDFEEFWIEKFQFRNPSPPTPYSSCPIWSIITQTDSCLLNCSDVWEWGEETELSLMATGVRLSSRETEREIYKGSYSSPLHSTPLNSLARSYQPPHSRVLLSSVRIEILPNWCFAAVQLVLEPL